MKKYKINFETIKFPLIILLLAVLLRGLSNTILSEPVINFISENYSWVLTISSITKSFSELVIKYLPLLIIIKILSKKHSSDRVVLMFIISYFLFLTITMVLGDSGMPAIVYDELFGMSTSVSQSIIGNGSTILRPYRMGFIGAIIVAYVADLSFKITRSRTRYGLLPYIDKDVLALITTILLTLIAGVVFTFIWPLFIGFLFKVFNWIANDITNPVSTFVYGFFDRVLSLAGISEINRATFWNTSLGGSWMSEVGGNFVGDIPIWNEQIKAGIFNSGFGRFVTPYYIINLFAIPGIAIGIYSSFTNKRERISNFSLLVFIIIISVFTDLSLPVEIFLLMMTPLLYGFHIFVVSSLFAILQGLKIFIGIPMQESVASASLGSGIDLFSYFKIIELRQNIIVIIVIGLIIGFIYFAMTKLYYSYFSLGLINKLDIDVLVEEFLEVVGGIDNIEKIDSSPLRIDVQLKRPQLFNYEKLEDSSISRVIETKTSYALYYGTPSTIMRKEILHLKEISEV